MEQGEHMSLALVGRLGLQQPLPRPSLAPSVRTSLSSQRRSGSGAPKRVLRWRKCSTPSAGIDPFPKLHMLHHTVDFAERYRFLGRASEAQIESYHASFNKLF